MSDIEVKNEELFKNELELIDESIDEINELYDEVKEHYDALKGTYAKGSLNFIQGQTANLISLKNAKLGMIKERIAIKKIQEDLIIKKKNADGDQGGADQAIVTDLLGKILKSEEGSKKGIKHVAITPDADDLLNNRLNNLLDKGEIELTDNDERIRFEKMGVKIIIVKKGDKWKFAALDKNNKQVKDYPLPDKKMFNITFKEDSQGRITAVDEDNRNYMVKVID